MLQSLRKRGLNPFEAYLAAIFSTKYLRLKMSKKRSLRFARALSGPSRPTSIS